MNLFQSLVEGVSNIFSVPPCQRCIVLEQWLESVKAENVELKDIIFGRNQANEPKETNESLQAVTRRSTLSSLRAQLEHESLARALKKREMSLEEAKFEAALAGSRNDA